MTHARLAVALVTSIVLGACAPEGSEPSESEDSSVRFADAGASLPNTPSAADAGSTPAQGGASDAGNAGVSDAGSAHDAGGAQPIVDGGSRADSGSGASASDAGSGGSTAPKPSAGCGKSGRPAGGRVSKQGECNYTFPASYDGARPFPLFIGFHAAGNPIEQIENLTKGSELETNYVRAFPKSKGSAWDYNADIANVNAMVDDLMANYCLDMNRVFGSGHSSGAQLIVQILTPAHKTDADHIRFKAVAPVAASRYGTVSRAIPVLYIQAQLDTVRNSSGADVVKEFVSANGCSMSTKPYTAAPSCMSSGKTVMNGCTQYEGCRAPTVWCSHDDPQYGNTFHGWPCFASKTISDFFASLP